MPKPPEYTITLDQPNPSLGDTVTFTIEGGDLFGLWLQISCSKAEQMVYCQSDSAWMEHAYQLGPTALWHEGPADGTAQLYTSKKGKLDKVISELDFSVAG